MPIEFVLSLQDALARLPDAQRPSQDQLEMFASSFLIPLEYEKLNSLCCPRCGSNTWDQVSRGSVAPKVGFDWPYSCPGGDEHNCRCKQCGHSLVVQFWFTKQAQPSRSEQKQTRHTAQADFKDADSSGGNELTQYLGNMLRELRALQLTTTTPSDSRLKRVEDFQTSWKLTRPS